MAIPATHANVAHLYRRAAFGGLPEEVEAGVGAGVEATVERLLDWSASPPDTDHPPLPDPREQRQNPGRYGQVTLDVQRWWVGRMIASPTPALEKLTLFWHGHFATSLRKVRALAAMVAQNQLFRRAGTGSFPELTRAVSKDPAMMVWLDLLQSRVGAPNENWARELLELFTMGRDNGYAQADVTEAARAFTGYRLDPAAGYAFRFVPRLHDGGTKTVLGVTGPLTGDDVIDVVMGRPETPRFVASRVWFRYASAAPPAGVLDDLTAAFAARLDTTDLLRALFTHPGFYAADVRHGLAAQPTETFVRLVRGLQVPPEVWQPAVVAIGFLGQVLFAPPNVGGWGHNGTWLGTSVSGSRALVGRRLGLWLAPALDQGHPVASELAGLLGDPDAFASRLFARLGAVELTPGTVEAMRGYLSSSSGQAPGRRLAGAVTLAAVSPEVVLS